jgi:hypothetical protein
MHNRASREDGKFYPSAASAACYLPSARAETAEAAEAPEKLEKARE